MNEDQDRRIADFLRMDAPPVRDPMFRIKVLERREHRQFQQRLFTMIAGAVMIIFISTFAIAGGALETTGPVAVIGAALASTYLAFRGQLPRILKRFSL